MTNIRTPDPALTTPPPVTTSTAAVVPSKRGRKIVARILGRYGALIALAVLLVFFSFQSPYFLTPGNLLQTVNQSALVAIVACGLTLVLSSGQFDLSVGNTVSLSGIIATTLMLNGTPIPLAILISLVAGIAVGLFNGFLVTVLEVNALVATLGTGGVLVGLNYLISGGRPQSVSADFPDFLSIAIGTWFGVPKLIYFMVVVVAILWFVLNKTDFGRNIRAVGGNPEAARLAGVRTRLVTTGAFVIAGAAAAVAGVALAASIGSGQPTGGDSFTLSSFAAAFLGSTVLTEGRFHILGTLVGVIVVAVGFNGLALIGVPSFAQFLFQAVLLIVAVALSSVGRRLSRA